LSKERLGIDEFNNRFKRVNKLIKNKLDGAKQKSSTVTGSKKPLKESDNAGQKILNLIWI
jgi:hypothetical protein